MQTRTLTLKDLALWVDNDEPLYRWWKGSRLSQREFVRRNRDELRAYVNRLLDQPPRRKHNQPQEVPTTRTGLRLTIEVDQCARDVNPNDGNGWKLYTFDIRTITSTDRDKFDPSEDDEFASQLADGQAFWVRYSGDTYYITDSTDRPTDGIVIWEGDADNLPPADKREDSADSFLSVYSDWANGNVYGYTLTDYRTGDEPGGHASCWGFIGDDITDGILDYEIRRLTGPGVYVVLNDLAESVLDRPVLERAGLNTVSEETARDIIAKDDRAALMQALLV